MTHSLIALKSVTAIGILVAILDVPAFPGATYSLLHIILYEILYANVCSRPPDPKISIFIV